MNILSQQETALLQTLARDKCTVSDPYFAMWQVWRFQAECLALASNGGHMVLQAVHAEEFHGLCHSAKVAIRWGDDGFTSSNKGIATSNKGITASS